MLLLASTDNNTVDCVCEISNKCDINVYDVFDVCSE